MKTRETLFWVGIGLAVLFVLSYFVKIRVETGYNYMIDDSLMGVIIFHNPIIFIIYVLILIALIVPFLISKLKQRLF
jgi:uncharacterized membrane protein